MPRLDGKPAAVGALGVIEQVGRLPGGEPAAVVRAVARGRIGVGTTGPGAALRGQRRRDHGEAAPPEAQVLGALWVEATILDTDQAGGAGDHPEGTRGRTAELAREYQALVTTLLQQRGAWQVVDPVQPSTTSPRSPTTPATPPSSPHPEAAAAGDRRPGRPGWRSCRPGPGEHLAEQDVAESIPKDVQEGVDRQQREFLLRRQLEAVRKELPS